MNRVLSAYLARVATAAEHAPFGTAGAWQVNRFFNSSLVWAAKSVVENRDKDETEQTGESKEHLQKAIARFHTTLGMYRLYTGSDYSEDGLAAGVACPKLELPHVSQYLGLDREIPKEKINDMAKASAGAALMAAVTGGYVSGECKARKDFYAAAYQKKTKAMAEAKAKNLRQLDSVYNQCWGDYDSSLYDEGEVESFTDRMRSTLMMVARANWLANKTKLSDDDMQMLNPERYEKAKAWMQGCELFLNEFGVSTEVLKTWETKLTNAVKQVADEYSGTTDALMAEIDNIEAEVMADIAEVEKQESMPTRSLRHLNKDGTLKATILQHNTGQAAAARKNEDAELGKAERVAKAEALAKKKLEQAAIEEARQKELQAKIKKIEAKQRRDAKKLKAAAATPTIMEQALAAAASTTTH